MTRIVHMALGKRMGHCQNETQRHEKRRKSRPYTPGKVRRTQGGWVMQTGFAPEPAGQVLRQRVGLSGMRCLNSRRESPKGRLSKAFTQGGQDVLRGMTRIYADRTVFTRQVRFSITR